MKRILTLLLLAALVLSLAACGSTPKGTVQTSKTTEIPVPTLTLEPPSSPLPTPEPEPETTPLDAGRYKVLTYGSSQIIDESSFYLFEEGYGMLTVGETAGRIYNLGALWSENSLEIERQPMVYDYDGQTLRFDFEGNAVECAYTGESAEPVIGSEDFIGYYETYGALVALMDDGTGVFQTNQGAQPVYWGHLTLNNFESDYIVLDSYLSGLDFVGFDHNRISFREDDDTRWTLSSQEFLKGQEVVSPVEEYNFKVNLIDDSWTYSKTDEFYEFSGPDNAGSFSFYSYYVGEGAVSDDIDEALDYLAETVAEQAGGTLYKHEFVDFPVAGYLGRGMKFDLNINGVTVNNACVIWVANGTAYYATLTEKENRFADCMRVYEGLLDSFRQAG